MFLLPQWHYFGHGFNQRSAELACGQGSMFLFLMLSRNGEAW